MGSVSEKKRRLLPAEWPWFGVLAVVLVLGIWWFPGVAGTPRDSFSASGGGKKAYYLLTTELFGDVSRETEFLGAATWNAETLCIIGPLRGPTDSEWETLRDWVMSGGRLLYAARPDMAADLEPVVHHILDPDPLCASGCFPADARFTCRCSWCAYLAAAVAAGFDAAALPSDLS